MAFDFMKPLAAFYWWTAKQAFFFLLWTVLYIPSVLIALFWATTHPRVVYSTRRDWMDLLKIVATFGDSYHRANRSAAPALAVAPGDEWKHCDP
jgi:hypothetical protein